MVESPTRFPDVSNHNTSLLDPSIDCASGTVPDFVDAPLGSSHHRLVRCPLNAAVAKNPQQVASGTTSRDWDGMRSFYLSYSWGLVYFSSDDLSTSAVAVAHVVLQGMELYIFL